jgi:hypothetical protein
VCFRFEFLGVVMLSDGEFGEMEVDMEGSGWDMSRVVEGFDDSINDFRCPN